MRVVEVHRSGFALKGDGIEAEMPPDAAITVGDWLLYDREAPSESRLLERTSLIKRRAPGHDRREQLIAANIDTAFIVTSCNADFNIARLERYVALAFEAEVTPVILLTKPDLCDDPERYAQEAATVSELVPVVVVNAKSDAPVEVLRDWCKPGQTVAFLGSSGVGKSTLTNALMRDDAIETQAIREDDAKGRHTTTRRELYVIPGGPVVLDTPGMRELQLTDAAYGLETLFSDLTELAASCRFRDCAHDTEPGCAIRAAVERGDVDADRLERWRKLDAEDRFNSETLAERRSRDKSFGKMVKQAMKAKKSR